MSVRLHRSITFNYPNFRQYAEEVLGFYCLTSFLPDWPPKDFGSYLDGFSFTDYRYLYVLFFCGFFCPLSVAVYTRQPGFFQGIGHSQTLCEPSVMTRLTMPFLLEGDTC